VTTVMLVLTSNKSH